MPWRWAPCASNDFRRQATLRSLPHATRGAAISNVTLSLLICIRRAVLVSPRPSCSSRSTALQKVMRTHIVSDVLVQYKCFAPCALMSIRRHAVLYDQREELPGRLSTLSRTRFDLAFPPSGQNYLKWTQIHCTVCLKPLSAKVRLLYGSSTATALIGVLPTEPNTRISAELELRKVSCCRLSSPSATQH